MRYRPSFCFALLSASLLSAPGCGGDPAESTASSTSSSSAGGTGGGGAGGGTGGEEPLPPLDPAACPIAADSGADPAIAEAAEEQYDATFKVPASGSVEQDKAFFLATLLGADAALLADMGADPALAAISADRDDRLRTTAAMCAGDVACLGQALTWADDETKSAGSALAALLESKAKLASFAEAMRKSGRFALHATDSDTDLVQSAFFDFATALNKTFNDEAGSLGGAAMQAVVLAADDAHPAPFDFFEPLLEVDLAALIADKRDEATRYEPLAEGENAKALAAIPGIDWKKYPFTVILVPGKGPDEAGVELDPLGQKRADMAAQRFAAGIAPLIALSGGHVHPDRTPYSEAIEMKKYLRATYNIPEEALLVDPHARHTTTNLRNVSRLLYRYGVPADRPLLVTSDFGQSLYIGHWHGTFGPRCMDELGYLPWRSLVPISEFDSCMVPVAVSLHADGRDPLDP